MREAIPIPGKSEKSGGITPKRVRFAAEYVIDLNATQAAIRAGYSPKTAKQQGSRLLSKADVQREIAERQGKVAAKAEVTIERVVAEFAKIGFANMADYMKSGPDGDPYLDFSALTRDQAAALSEVTVEDYVEGRGENARDVKRVKFKLASKIDALEKLGRHLGMFVERHEVTGTLQVERIERELVDVTPRPGLLEEEAQSGDDAADQDRASVRSFVDAEAV